MSDTIKADPATADTAAADTRASQEQKLSDVPSKPTKLRTESQPPPSENSEFVDTVHHMDTESEISVTSFKRWHKFLQNEHDILHHTSFKTWKCCYKCCLPCRWFDSIAYDLKICKCCMTFKTFKTWGTIVIAAIFFYIFMYSIFKEEVFPTGTIFFIFLLCLTAYVVGYSLILIGLPPVLGHFSVGILFGNVPQIKSMNNDNQLTYKIGETTEKILIVIAIIRAGLLLDLKRLRHHFSVVILLSIIPFFSGTLTATFFSSILAYLPWDWSILQGSLMNVVSLASIMTVMTKNKFHGYGEDKDLSAVLIAAGVINTAIGLVVYSMSISYILAEDDTNTALMSMLFMFRDFTIATLVGLIAGLLLGFFPDKRSTEAAGLRIILLGLASFSLSHIFYEFQMITEAYLSTLVLSVVAINIWEELGWHKENNPVLYFYSMAYYVSQPVVVSLLGFTLNFHEVEGGSVGKAIAVFFFGLFFRLVACFLILFIKSYPTNYKEKTYIGIAWSSVGTFQALLASSLQHVSFDEFDDSPETAELVAMYTNLLTQNTIICILLSTPLVCFLLTILAPVMLKTVPMDPIPRRRATSIKVAGFGL